MVMMRFRHGGSHTVLIAITAMALTGRRLYRRRIVVEDYDFGRTVRHEFVLLKSNRIDCYRVAVDGRLLPGRIGWARSLEMIRKAFLRATTRDFECP